MNWPSLEMGGYGFYIWGSYIFALLAIVWELVTLSYRKKVAREQEKSAPKVLSRNANETSS
jgi:heme exporter protein D